jgi:uroporphyrinogen-III synthase
LADSLRDALNGPVVAACVGPVCGGAARDEGIRSPVQPAKGRLGLLVRSLTQALEDRPARSGPRREAGPE